MHSLRQTAQDISDETAAEEEGAGIQAYGDTDWRAAAARTEWKQLLTDFRHGINCKEQKQRSFELLPEGFIDSFKASWQYQVGHQMPEALLECTEQTGDLGSQKGKNWKRTEREAWVAEDKNQRHINKVHQTEVWKGIQTDYWEQVLRTEDDELPELDRLTGLLGLP